VKQQIEDLGLDRNETACAAQLPALDVERAILERVDHHVSPARLLKEKSRRTPRYLKDSWYRQE
jgi:hypothetical protein